MLHHKSIIAIIAITLSSSACVEPAQDSPSSAEQYAATPTVRTIKVPYLAPFAGSLASGMRPVISFGTTDENFPGYISPVTLDNGSVIVGARAWVRVVAGSFRLSLCTNTQTVGSDPGNGGCNPIAQSAPSNATTAVQLLAVPTGLRVPVISGTTFWLHVGATTQQGTSGVAQLGGLEVDLSSSL